MKKVLLLLAIPLTIACFLVSCGSDSSSRADSGDTDKASATATAAKSGASGTYENIRAADLDGAWHSLSEWVGRKPVVINIWGTWCPPCRREIPDLVRLYDEYGDQVEIVSFALERRAGPEQVKAFTEQAGMNWVHLLANEDILRAFRYDGSVPTTIFLDENAREIGRHIGARDYNTFKRDFEAVLGT